MKKWYDRNPLPIFVVWLAIDWICRLAFGLSHSLNYLMFALVVDGFFGVWTTRLLVMEVISSRKAKKSSNENSA